MSNLEKNKNYQIKLYNSFAKYIGSPFWPKYPPYADIYFEEYFYKKYLEYITEENNEINSIYIPLNWTFFIKRNFGLCHDDLKRSLNSLDNSYSYFTVCTHDNAPPYWFNFPSKTKIFCGAYYDIDPLLNNINENFFKKYIPIPLVVSPTINSIVSNKKNIHKKYLASFVGQNTNDLRDALTDKYQKNSKFYIEMIINPNIKINDGKDASAPQPFNFIQKSLESYFILCPRGVSPTSYRLYEAMQLNRVPVYISDIFWLPYQDKINWDNICVFIKPNEINNLEDILEKELISGNYEKKLSYINKIYDQYFTFESTFNNILKTLS
jgi:hypothetical protein